MLTQKHNCGPFHRIDVLRTVQTSFCHAGGQKMNSPGPDGIESETSHAISTKNLVTCDLSVSVRIY